MEAEGDDGGDEDEGEGEGEDEPEEEDEPPALPQGSRDEENKSN